MKLAGFHFRTWTRLKKFVQVFGKSEKETSGLVRARNLVLQQARAHVGTRCRQHGPIGWYHAGLAVQAHRAEKCIHLAINSATAITWHPTRTCAITIFTYDLA